LYTFWAKRYTKNHFRCTKKDFWCTGNHLVNGQRWLRLSHR
jgi:hypothetical protein